MEAEGPSLPSSAGTTLKAVVPSRPKRRSAGPGRTLMLILGLGGILAVTFVLLARSRLAPTATDIALADMGRLLDRTASRVGGIDGELPQQWLTDLTRTTAPPGGAGDVEELLDPVSSGIPTIDPWGNAFLIAAGRASSGILLACISPGPNGVFETRSGDRAAVGDDLLRQREVPAAR